MDALVSTGLAAAGYASFNYDDGIVLPARDATGNLVPDPSIFPDGLAAMVSYAHSRGLKFGMYSDRGTETVRRERKGGLRNR
jgi:alpha-galactosidase